MIRWNVWLNGHVIDIVFWNDRSEGGSIITAEEVRRSLVGHDGYNPAIIVRKERSR